MRSFQSYKKPPLSVQEIYARLVRLVGPCNITEMLCVANDSVSEIFRIRNFFACATNFHHVPTGVLRSTMTNVGK